MLKQGANWLPFRLGLAHVLCLSGQGRQSLHHTPSAGVVCEEQVALTVRGPHALEKAHAIEGLPWRREGSRGLASRLGRPQKHLSEGCLECGTCMPPL